VGKADHRWLCRKIVSFGWPLMEWCRRKALPLKDSQVPSCADVAPKIARHAAAEIRNFAGNAG